MRFFPVLAFLLAPAAVAPAAGAQGTAPGTADACGHSPSSADGRERVTAVPSGLARSFDGLFTYFLSDALRLAGNPGRHGSHYLEAACIAETVLVPALSNFIAANVTSFPSSTPQVGVTYDFSTGVPVRQVESLGPIFTETPGTIGAGRLSLGANVSALTLDLIRGEPLSGVEFNFVHVDVADEGLGESAFERDLLVVRPRLNVDAVIYGLFANYGVTDRLDVGVAVPVVSLSLEGRAEAEIFAYSGGDPNLHFFGGTTEAPVLEAAYPYETSETFIPAVDVRAKYQVPGRGASLGLVGAVSLPTSPRGGLLGDRELGGRVSLVGSSTFGPAAANVNVGYDRRGTAGDSDAALVAVGLDANLSERVSVAGALLGAVPVGEPTRFYDTEAEVGAPGSAVQYVLDDLGPGGALVQVEEPFSTIEDGADATVLLSVGSRFAPSEDVQGFVNVLVPVVRGGLQSTIAPTVGLSVSL